MSFVDCEAESLHVQHPTRLLRIKYRNVLHGTSRFLQSYKSVAEAIMAWGVHLHHLVIGIHDCLLGWCIAFLGPFLAPYKTCHNAHHPQQDQKARLNRTIELRATHHPSDLTNWHEKLFALCFDRSSAFFYSLPTQHKIIIKQTPWTTPFLPSPSRTFNPPKPKQARRRSLYKARCLLSQLTRFHGSPILPLERKVFSRNTDSLHWMTFLWCRMIHWHCRFFMMMITKQGQVKFLWWHPS